MRSPGTSRPDASTVALLGATGWIGSMILEWLTSCEGLRVVRVPVRGATLSGIRSDLAHSGASTVINASGARLGTSEQLAEVNCGVVRECLAYCRTTGAALRHLGSAAEYGPHGDLRLAERMMCSPVSDYGLTKLMATELISSASASGLDAVCLRLFNVVGPSPGRGTVFGDMVERVKNAEAEIVLDDFDVVRDFVDANDVVKVVAASIAVDLPPVVNVGTGAGLRLEQVVGALAASRGRDVVRGVLRGSRVRCAVADVRLLATYLPLPAPLTPQRIAQLAML